MMALHILCFMPFLTSLRKNYHENAGKIALLILKESLGAVGLGLLFGYLTTFFLHHVWSAKVEIGISVAVSYLAFYVAQGPAGVSGLICLVVTGLVVAADRPFWFQSFGSRCVVAFLGYCIISCQWHCIFLFGIYCYYISHNILE
eukprot:jgi/Galph1/2660/GphlegSOOS_G1345.1